MLIKDQQEIRDFNFAVPHHSNNQLVINQSHKKNQMGYWGRTIEVRKCEDENRSCNITQWLLLQKKENHSNWASNSLVSVKVPFSLVWLFKRYFNCFVSWILEIRHLL